MSVSDGLDNNGADVPANESDGTWTGGGTCCAGPSVGHCVAPTFPWEELTLLPERVIPEDDLRGNTLQVPAALAVH